MYLVGPLLIPFVVNLGIPKYIFTMRVRDRSKLGTNLPTIFIFGHTLYIFMHRTRVEVEFYNALCSLYHPLAPIQRIFCLGRIFHDDMPCHDSVAISRIIKIVVLCV